MASLEPKYIFVLDHGSRSGPPIIAEEHVALVIDRKSLLLYYYSKTPALYAQLPSKQRISCSHTSLLAMTIDDLAVIFRPGNQHYSGHDSNTKRLL